MAQYSNPAVNMCTASINWTPRITRRCDGVTGRFGREDGNASGNPRYCRLFRRDVPLLRSASASGGHTPPPVPNEASEIIGQVDHADLEGGACLADGSDKEAHAAL